MLSLHQLLWIAGLVIVLLALPQGWGAHQWTIQMRSFFKILYVSLDSACARVYIDLGSTSTFCNRCMVR
jgi:hypothetical protein